MDPRYGVIDNANRRYARYHKLQRAASQIPLQIAANALELARVEQLRADLALAETPQEIGSGARGDRGGGLPRASLIPMREAAQGGKGKQANRVASSASKAHPVGRRCDGSRAMAGDWWWVRTVARTRK